MSNKTLMNTIDNTYKRCLEENIGISRNFLRSICVNNVLPTCKIGNKYLINWNVFMAYLNGNLNKPEENETNETYTVNKVRRIK